MRKVSMLIIAIAAVAAIGIGVNAFAHSGGWGGGWGHHGMGWHHQGGYGPAYGDQLSEKEYRQLEQKREAFFNDTRGVRARLYEKERELGLELAKTEPDAAKAARLQKDISELQGQFDQKRIDHMVEMRKLNPSMGRGFMAGGPMMGYGSQGGGYCW